jgi:hypothetical protein
MTIPLQHIHARATERPSGYAEDVLAHGRVVGEALEMADADYEALCRKYRVETAWPPWALVIKVLRAEPDMGVGDTVARIIGPIGGDAFKTWYKATFGVACNCATRQAEWNALYRYETKEKGKETE